MNDNAITDPTPGTIAAAGFCLRCGTTHSITMGSAIDHCKSLMDCLKQEQRIDLDRPAAESDPRCSTAILYQRLGQMFGILVCRDQDGQEIILKAFSYRHNNLWEVPGWVAPLADPVRYDATVEFGNSLIHPLTDQINGMTPDNPYRPALVEQRKRHSHRIMDDLYNLYEVQNFRGERRLLQEIFHADQPKMAMGTGDCCAPKLLNHAARHGLTPIALAEFYWGKSSHDGKRNEGEFYPACVRRCQPILGFLLCGLE